MKITNTGTKIVNVGAAAILPGETSPELPDSFQGNPTLNLFQKKGFITIDDGGAAADKEAAEKKAAEAAAKKKAAEEAAKAAAGTGSK